MPLTIAHEDRGRHAVLTVVGDLDLATAPELTRLGLELVEAGATSVVVDAQKLAFCDSSGLSALVQIANRLDDSRLAIAAPTPIVRRVLEMSGLVDAFVVTDSLPDALAALDR
jgi:anti-anti-sigma factor